jgi:hypothetical protein
MPFDAAISFAGPERAVARTLAGALRSDGFDVFRPREPQYVGHHAADRPSMGPRLKGDTRFGTGVIRNRVYCH